MDVVQNRVQLNPKLRSNTTRVIDMLEFHLRQISIANGDLTDGVAVDRLRDVRKQPMDVSYDFRRYSGLVKIVVQGWEWEKKVGEFSNAKRKTQNIWLYCYQQLASDQSNVAISIDQIQDWLRHDIEWRLYRDMQKNFQEAQTGLNAQVGPWGGIGEWGPILPSCSLLRMVKEARGSSREFPNCEMALQLQYEYDEFGPDGTPGYA